MCIRVGDGSHSIWVRENSNKARAMYQYMLQWWWFSLWQRTRMTEIVARIDLIAVQMTPSVHKPKTTWDQSELHVCFLFWLTDSTPAMKSSSAKSTASCTVSCWLDSNSEKNVGAPQLCPAGCRSAWSALFVWFVGCCWNPYFDINSSTNLKHKLEFFWPFLEIYVHLYIYVYCYVLY